MKYAGTRFAAMDAVDLLLNAQGCLLKLCVITGWQMPEDELQAILVDQFTKKLAESYGDVNVAEMEFAFRTYGTTVKDWGKQVNLSLIDEVMTPYLTSRREVSRLEEQKTTQALPAPQEDLSDQAMTDWMQFTRSRVRSGVLTVSFMPLPLYEWLDKRGDIKTDKAGKHEYLRKATDFRHGQLIEAVENDNSMGNRDRLTKFMIMKQARTLTGDEIDIVKNLARKMVLFDMLKG